MPKVTIITLSPAERAALEKAAKYGATPSFRLRRQALLLKTDKRTSLDVAQQLGCCEMAVNNWIARYQEQGLAGLHIKKAGLHIKKGRGRKSILQTDTDLEAVRRAVVGNRQRISLAKAQLEQELGKTFGVLALKRFLKKTVAAIKTVAATNECAEP